MSEKASHLRFDEKKPLSKLIHVTADTPIDMLATQFHREASESDNSAAKAADTGITAADVTFRVARETSYHRKLKARRDIPEQTEQPKSAKLQQKKALKKDYADAKRTSESTAKASEIASKAAESAGEKVRQTVEYVRKNSHVILIVLTIGALLLVFMSIISSCSMMFSGALGSVSSTTYSSSAEDMRATEELYCRMENNLQTQLDNYAVYFPGYDEYIVSGTVSGHDPHELAAILSAMQGEYSPADVGDDLDRIFAIQYTINTSVRTVTRYRTETRTEYREVQNPANGAIYLVPYTCQVQVPYSHTICSVTLTNVPLSDAADELLTYEQQELYTTYMETKGNYPDLFSDE